MLLLLSAVLAIAFMQPLVSFLGGLTLLLGVGGLIFRDLSPASQDAVERRLIGWLRRTRAIGSTPPPEEQIDFRRPLTANPEESGAPAEQSRRGRIKSSPRRPTAGGSPAAGPTGDTATGDTPPPAV